MVKSRSRIYCCHITVYRPEPPPQFEIDKFESWCDQYCKKWAFQHEKSKKGMHHLQAIVSMQVKARTSTIINLIAEECGWEHSHVHVSPSNERSHGSFSYVLKDKTRVAGPWASVSLNSLAPVKILETDNLFTWQKICYNICTGPSDDRTVYNFLNRSGGFGKTQFLKYIASHHPKEVGLLPSMGTAIQILTSVVQLGSRHCFILDLPRSAFLTEDKQGEIMHAIEKIKDGVIITPMYGKVQQLIINHPNVVIFSNEGLSGLTQSRWKTFDMDQMSEDDWWAEWAKFNGPESFVGPSGPVISKSNKEDCLTC